MRLLLLLTLFISNECRAQKSPTLYFVEVKNVYLSGLVETEQSLLMLKQRRTIPSIDFDKYLFSLCKQRIARYSELLDSLNKEFEIYSVEFSNDDSGKLASNLFKNKEYYRGFLLTLDTTRNSRGVVVALLVNKFTLPLTSVIYRVTHQTVGYYLDENRIEISKVISKHSR
jgi:hypothetical protein